VGRSRLDGSAWVRLARRVGAALDSDPEYLPLDATNGALVVTGAGAAPAATSLRIADGTVAGEADVTAGRLAVDTGLAQPQTDGQARAAPQPVVQTTSSVFAGFTGNAEEQAARQGRYRFAGGKVTTSVVSPNGSITLTNPAASGVDLILTRYSVEVDAAADVVLIMGATSSGTLMDAMNVNQRTTVTNPGEVRVGSGVIVGGTVGSLIRRADPNSPVSVGPFRFRIPPGATFTVRYLGPGATNTVWFGIGWFVVPAGLDLT
jgi:hypothetical protein